MRLPCFFLLLLSLHCPSAAQSNWFQKFDSLITRKYAKSNFDTAYVVRPAARWTLKARLNISGIGIDTKGQEAGETFSSRLRAEYRQTVSFAAAYRGLAVGFAINPSLTKKNSDTEFNFNSYGRRLTSELVFSSANTFSGDIRQGSEKRTIEKGALHQSALQANFQYVFNHRRFSYPAAFSQTYLQKKSAGSWLAGLSFRQTAVKADANAASGLPSLRLRMAMLGIGGGYGYNFVHRQWLFHLSANPTFIVYNHAKMSFGEDVRRLSYKFPEVIITGRGAVVRSFGRYFAGMSMVFHFSTVGNSESLQIQNTQWRLRTFFGLRF